jgi:hypothetical protein
MPARGCVVNGIERRDRRHMRLMEKVQKGGGPDVLPPQSRRRYDKMVKAAQAWDGFPEPPPFVPDTDDPDTNTDTGGAR